MGLIVVICAAYVYTHIGHPYFSILRVENEFQTLGPGRVRHCSCWVSAPPLVLASSPDIPAQSNHRSQRLITENKHSRGQRCQYPTLSLSVWIAHPHCQINRVEN